MSLALPSLTIKATYSEVGAGFYCGGRHTYLSSEKCSSVIFGNIDMRIEYQLSLAWEPDVKPFQGYTISLIRIPGDNYEERHTHQNYFYRKEFVGNVVARVNFMPKVVDGKTVWETRDGKSLPYDLVLEFDLNIKRKFWQKNEKYRKTITCNLELATLEEMNNWKPYSIYGDEKETSKQNSN
jgi:hypothetical protein